MRIQNIISTNNTKNQNKIYSTQSCTRKPMQKGLSIDTVSFKGLTNPPEIEKFVNKFGDIFAGMVFEEGASGLGKYSCNKELGLTKVLEIISKCHDRMNAEQCAIVKKATPDKIEDLLTQLLEHKHKYPFEVEVTGNFNKVNLLKRNNFLTGTRDIEHYNQDMFNFLAAGELENKVKELDHNGIKYIFKTLIDKDGLPSGIMALIKN